MYHRFDWTRGSIGRNRFLGFLEPVQPFFFLALARRLGTRRFLDVGSNIGAYSMFFSTVEGIETIIAFEPAPTAFSELSQNVARNQLESRIDCRRKAVSDAEGTLKFGLVSETSGSNRVVERSKGTGEDFSGFIEVAATTLDRELPWEGEIVAIKIDVEGHEDAVLAGAEQLLLSNSCLLQIENFSGSNTDTTLEGFGYRQVYRIGPDVYYANADILDAVLISALNEAIEILIQHNRHQMEKEAGFWRSGGEVTVPLFPGIAIRLTGKASALARSALHALRRSGLVGWK